MRNQGLCRFKISRRSRASRYRILTSHDGPEQIFRAVLTSSRDGPVQRSFQTDVMLSLLHSNAKFSISFPLTRVSSYPRDIFPRHIRYANEGVHTGTNQIIPIETSTHTHIHPHTRIHMHIRIHTHAYTNE
jgi:hypothetical protein